MIEVDTSSPDSTPNRNRLKDNYPTTITKSITATKTSTQIALSTQQGKQRQLLQQISKTSHLAMETATREKGTALDQQITFVALDTTTQEVITKRPTGQQTQLELKLQIVG